MQTFESNIKFLYNFYLIDQESGIIAKGVSSFKVKYYQITNGEVKEINSPASLSLSTSISSSFMQIYG